MNNDLGKGDIGKTLIRFSIPTIIGSLIVMLYTIVDRIFIGQKLGSTALAAVSITFPFTQIAVSLGALIGMGGTAIISIKLGEKNKEGAANIIGNQITLFLIFCTLITILQEFFLVDLLNLIGATPETLPQAVSYARIFIPVIFFQCFTYGLNGGIRAHGFPKYAMTTSCIGAFLNIILDYVFLFPLDMGVFGAGLATFISSAIAATFNIMFFIRTNKYPVRLKLEYFRLKKNIVYDIVTIGAPSGIIQFSNALVMSIFNTQLSKFSGAAGISAYGIFMTMHSLNVTVVQGIAQGGMQPLIGYNLGANNYPRVVKTIKLTIVYTMILTVVLMSIIQIFPDKIMSIFINDPSTISIGMDALRKGFSVLPFMMATILISTIYTSLKEAKLAFRFILLRKIILVIPVVLILPGFMGIDGVWFSRPVSDTMAFIIMTYCFSKKYKELQKKAVLV